MRKIIIIFVLLLLIPITKVEGAWCSFSEIARLKKIASNVNASYDYIENGTSVIFEVTLTNLNPELYFVDSTSSTQYNYTSDEIKISNYESGQTISYVFYPVDANCSDEPLYTVRVVLPTYNQYYRDEICEGIENYSLCQKWSSHNLSYATFVERVTNYKNSLIVPEPPIEEPPTPEEVTVVQLIVNFLLDYYIYIIIVLLLALACILAIRKKDDIYS